VADLSAASTSHCAIGWSFDHHLSALSLVVYKISAAITSPNSVTLFSDYILHCLLDECPCIIDDMRRETN
jgi:hypothetical protein